MNKISTLGRLAADPELKQVNGRNCANFRMASTNKRKEQDGTYGTNWYRVTCWGATADVAAKYLKKGQRVGVSGDLTIRQYIGTDGQQKTSVEIDNADIDLVETRAEAGATAAAAPAQAATPAPQFTQVESSSDELPF